MASVKKNKKHLTNSPPIIGISACRKHREEFDHHGVYHKYIEVILKLGALPFIIPSVGDMVDTSPLLQRLDGLLLTGSNTHIEPRLYNQDPCRAESPCDKSRDATTLPMIRSAIAQGLPIFAICRGLQEMNVALGGSLYQTIHSVEGRLKHFLGEDVPLDTRYGPVHMVKVLPESWLEKWVAKPQILVNSIHTQAIDRLGQHLVTEGLAEDGTIEAVRADARGFAYGVQWHPEHKFAENSTSCAIFGAFKDAVENYATRT